MREPIQLIRTAEARLTVEFVDEVPIVRMEKRTGEWVPVRILAEGEQELDLLLALLVAICDRPDGRIPDPRYFSRDS